MHGRRQRCARACLETVTRGLLHERVTTDFSAINAQYFEAHPLTAAEPPALSRHRLPSGLSLRVAVIGSGPAPLYAATELTDIPGVEVTIIERLPTPFGLVRAEVAPDHEDTKRIADRSGACWAGPTCAACSTWRLDAMFR